MDILLQFKTKLLNVMPKLVENGLVYEKGKHILNDHSNLTSIVVTPASSESNLNIDPMIINQNLQKEVDNDIINNSKDNKESNDILNEDDVVISVNRQNSKFIDVKQSFIDKFGSLDQIPQATNDSNTIRTLRRDSLEIPTTINKNLNIINSKDNLTAQNKINFKRANSSSSNDVINAVRFNSLDRLTDISKIKLMNPSAIVNTHKNQDIDDSHTLVKTRTDSDDLIDLVNVGSNYNKINNKEKKNKGYEFDASFGKFTLHTAIEIYQAYKRGEKLNRKTIHRVLRHGYKTLSKFSNTRYLNLMNNTQQPERLTIVGDIHGQLYDLIHILDESGLPSHNNKYIFNGDFVDRGSMGIEVTIILLAFHIVLPSNF